MLFATFSLSVSSSEIGNSVQSASVNDNKKSHIKVLLPYHHIAPFSENLAVAKSRDTGWYGFINKKGEVVIPFEYDMVGNFHNGLAPVINTRKKFAFGYIDKTGKFIIQPQYDNALDFIEDLAAVRKDDKWGYINTKNKLVIPFEYDSVNDFSDGLAVVKKNNKYAVIDKTGKLIIPFDYDFIYNFHKGTTVAEKDNQYYEIDKTGKIIKQSEHHFFSENDKRQHRNIFDKKYNRVSDFGVDDGIFAVGIGDCKATLANNEESDCKWGFIDKNGKEIIPFQYEDTLGFNEGLASVRKNKKYGVIDKTGKWIVEPQFIYIYPFKDGLAAFKHFDEQGKQGMGFIDKTGKIVIPKQSK